MCIRDRLLTTDMDDKLISQINQEVDAATEYVEALPYPNIDTFYSHIYKTDK